MTTANAQVPTVGYQRTGQAAPVYLGGEAPAESSATPTPTDRGDDLSTATAAATQPVAPTDPATKPQATADAATPAAADSVTSDDDPPRNDKGQFIPRRRFDEVNQRRKAAEDKLAQIERENKATQQAQDATYDFDAKEKEYLDLVARW